MALLVLNFTVTQAAVLFCLVSVSILHIVIPRHTRVGLS